MSQVKTPEGIVYRELLKKHGRKSLADEEGGKGLDLYGVVHSVKPTGISISKTKEYYMTVYTYDPSLVDLSLIDRDKVKMGTQIFRREKEELELIQENDIIVFKNAEIKDHNDKPQITATSNSHIAIFAPNDLEKPKNDHVSVDLFDYDKEIIEHLSRWNQSYTNKPNAKTSTGRPLLETAEIKTTKAKYFDYVGMVVAFKDDHRDDHLEVLLTDFTKNPQPASADRDDHLNIGNDHLIWSTLFDENVDTCPSLQPGDYIHLRNCRQNTRDNVLEIRLGGDREGKILVTKLDENDKRLKKLVERKQNHVSSTKRRRIEIKAYALRTNVVDLKKFTTIENILQQQDTGSFLTRAFITECKPKDVSKWIRAWCAQCTKSTGKIGEPCVQCGGVTETVFKFGMLIEDDKGLPLLLYAFHENAATLFPDFSAEEAYSNKGVFKKLKKIMKLACDKSEKIYFEIGLKSYNSEEHPSYKNYMITNTEFLLDED